MRAVAAPGVITLLSLPAAIAFADIPPDEPTVSDGTWVGVAISVVVILAIVAVVVWRRRKAP